MLASDDNTGGGKVFKCDCLRREGRGKEWKETKNRGHTGFVGRDLRI